MRRWWCRWPVLLCGVVMLTVGTCIFRLRSTPAVNVLLITLDTTRADRIGCYQYAPALTPALDTLSLGGVLFERAYAVAPLTLPSHATLFTGLNPPEHGLRDNGQGKLAPEIPTLAKILRHRNYRTGAFVGSFVLDSKFGLDQGFEVYDDDLEGGEYAYDALHRRRSGDRVVDSALEWLNAKTGESFFCWVHLYDPHAPYDARPKQFGERFNKQPYDAGIAFADQQIGRLLEHLRTRGLDRNTLIVVVGDHGEDLGEHGEREHGNRLYNSTLHVPLIFSLPTAPALPQRITAPVSLVDVSPTILDCLSIPFSSQISGHSLRGAWSGTTGKQTSCYSETDSPLLVHGWAPLRSLTTERWKLIRTTRPELYDLLQDPNETEDLASREPAQVIELDRQLSELERQLHTRDNRAAPLSSAEQKQMAGLGYLGGRRTAVHKPGESLADMKDMQQYHDAIVDARHALDEGHAEQAVQLLRRVVKALPNHLLSRVFLGEALLQTGESAEAVEIFQEILRTEPDRPDVLVPLGIALAAREDWQGATEKFQQAIDVDPDLAESHYRLAVAFLHLKQPQLARQQLADCLALDPGYVAAHLELAAMLAREGQVEDALQHCQTALKYRQNWPEAHTTWARILSGVHQFDEAIVHAQQAVKLDPLNADLHYNLGIYWAMKGDLDQAINCLEEAIRLKPQHPHATEQLQRIKQSRKARTETGN